MTAALPIEAAAAPAKAVGDWRRHLIALGAAWAAMHLLFHRDVFDIVALWLESATFNHCILLPPLIGWLVWQRLPELKQLEPTAWAPGLALVAAGAIAWLLGEAGSLALARHLGLVLMLQGAVVACLGRAVARGLLFPLFYAFFLIPVGEQLVPLLQTVTAKMCMVLLGWAGISAHIEGIFITTPAGYFKVAEACAGAQFLIAMLAYAALVANLCFTSTLRRAAFIAAAIIIPIIANGIRAAGTIYIAGISGIEFAAGFDHVFYGWIFFGIVIILLMAAGWPFFDRKPGDPWFDPRQLQPEGAPPAAPRRLVLVAAAAAGIAAAPLLWSQAIAATAGVPAPATIAMPRVEGWTEVPGGTGRAWRPRFAGADLIRMARYRDASGREVDLVIAVFARQDDGRELIAFGQGAADPDGDWSWTADSVAPAGGRGEYISSHKTIREVVSFYRIGSILTGSEISAKLATIRSRLLGGPQRAVAVLVSAEAAKIGAPRSCINSFLDGLGPIERVADEAAGLPRND